MKYLLLLACLAGCGDSPLLNHQTAAAPGRTIQSARASVFKRLGVSFQLDWKAGCPSFDDCSFTLNLSEPLSVGDVVFAELWMPSMGHGSSPFTITQLGPSSWSMSDVYFIMAGDWELVLQVKQGTKVRDEVRLDYRL